MAMSIHSLSDAYALRKKWIEQQYASMLTQWPTIQSYNSSWHLDVLTCRVTPALFTENTRRQKQAEIQAILAQMAQMEASARTASRFVGSILTYMTHYLQPAAQAPCSVPFSVRLEQMRNLQLRLGTIQGAIATHFPVVRDTAARLTALLEAQNQT